MHNSWRCRFFFPCWRLVHIWPSPTLLTPQPIIHTPAPLPHFPVLSPSLSVPGAECCAGSGGRKGTYSTPSSGTPANHLAAQPPLPPTPKLGRGMSWPPHPRLHASVSPTQGNRESKALVPEITLMAFGENFGEGMTWTLSKED